VANKVLSSLFDFLDVQVVNSLLKQNNLTAGLGFQIKMSLSQFEASVVKLLARVDKAYFSSESTQFKLSNDFCNLLIMDKQSLNDLTIIYQIFSHLKLTYIKDVLEKFKPDE
jgi:hypothetical protein